MIRLRPPVAFFATPAHLLSRAVIERHVGHPTGVLRACNDNQVEG